MIIRKPYKYLIRNFKKIHLILSVILFYVCYKTNVLYNYFKSLIDGTISRNLSLNYINNFIIILIMLSLVLFLIIYILMRHKKKPKLFYITSIFGYIIVIIVLLLNYSYLEVIKLEYIEQKEIRLYRDLVKLVLYYQYFECIFILIRGLGFDIKKFNFNKDIQEFNIEDVDNEEIEVDLNLDYNKIDGKVNRTKRELKYYFYENKIFIIIIIFIIIFVMLLLLLNYNFNINKKYDQNELIKIGNYELSIEKTFISNKNFSNKKISNNDNIIVEFKIKNNSNNYDKYNLDNFTINYDGNIIYPNNQLCKEFSDIGECYKEQKIYNEFEYYILVFQTNSEKINKNIIFRFRYKDKHYKFKLSEVSNKETEYKLGENINLANINLKDHEYNILSYNIGEKIDYVYQNCLSNGQCLNYNSFISSKVGIILQLNTASEIKYNNYGLNNSTFIEYYGKLKYIKDGVEYTSMMNNKTSDKINDKVFLEVDKQIIDAESIWIDFDIRGNKIKYIIK